MIGFKKLFSLGSTIAKTFPKRNIMPPKSLQMQYLWQMGGKISRSFASRRKNPNEKPERLVPLKYKIYDDETDQIKCSSPIVIMHGLLGCKENWNSMARQINRKTGRKVFTVDARNHGESAHTPHFSYEFMACDLILFLKTHNISRATLIGHSMGGRAAMMVAMRYPDLVRSMVVVDISPIGQSPNMLKIMKLMRDIKNLEMDRYWIIQDARKQAVNQLREKKYDEDLIAFILTNMVTKEGNTNWRWKFNLDVLIKNFEKEIVVFPIVNAPCYTRTLFLGGTNSDYLIPQEEPEIKKLFPLAEFAYIEGAGHWVHAEKPAQFVETVSAFLQLDPTMLQEDLESFPLGAPVEVKFKKYDEVQDESKCIYPVIILHGLLGSKQNWQSVAIRLNKKLGRTVYTLDARNHGESPHVERHTYETMVCDVMKFMGRRKITKATLIGHSMGGKTAMMLALMYPSLIKSLVVVDISPMEERPDPNALVVRKLLLDLKNLKLHPKLTANEARKRAAVQLKDKVKDERIIPFILANLVDNSDGTSTNWRWKFNLESIINNFDREVASFELAKFPSEVRTLFVAGTNSDYIKPDETSKIKFLFPLSTFKFIDGAGHWVHADSPAEFLRVVVEFIDQDPKDDEPPCFDIFKDWVF